MTACHLRNDGALGQALGDDRRLFAHGRAASCRLFLTTSETRQDGRLRASKRVFAAPHRGVEPAENRMSLQSDPAPPTKVDAVGEGEFEAEPAA